MLTSLLLLVVGLALLLGGGHALVVGASALARGLGVSPLFIGLTVVAFGTSAPELAVSLDAALSGRGDIAFGNLVGSNLANIGLILGVGALVRPLVIESRVLAREVPIMLLATAVMAVLALDSWLRGEPAAIDRADGLVLLLVFSVFLYTAVGEVLRRKEVDPLVQTAADSAATPAVPAGRRGRDVALVLGGLAALVVGGDLTVDAASTVARSLGVTDGVIGLTIVAVGTSLPELAASVIAATRGETDLAIGNVVGSNIFNLLFILGATASVSRLPVADEGRWDVIAVVVLSLAMLPLALTHGRRLVRWEGGVLLAAWAAYSVWRFAALPAV